MQKIRLRLGGLLFRLALTIAPEPGIPPTEPTTEASSVRESDGTWTEEFTEMERRLG